MAHRRGTRKVETRIMRSDDVEEEEDVEMVESPVPLQRCEQDAPESVLVQTDARIVLAHIVTRCRPTREVAAPTTRCRGISSIEVPRQNDKHNDR